jgi:hypothetical protein
MGMHNIAGTAHPTQVEPSAKLRLKYYTGSAGVFPLQSVKNCYSLPPKDGTSIVQPADNLLKFQVIDWRSLEFLCWHSTCSIYSSSYSALVQQIGIWPNELYPDSVTKDAMTHA